MAFVSFLLLDWFKKEYNNIHDSPIYPQSFFFFFFVFKGVSLLKHSPRLLSNSIVISKNLG